MNQATLSQAVANATERLQYTKDYAKVQIEARKVGTDQMDAFYLEKLTNLKNSNASDAEISLAEKDLAYTRNSAAQTEAYCAEYKATEIALYEELLAKAIAAAAETAGMEFPEHTGTGAEQASKAAEFRKAAEAKLEAERDASDAAILETAYTGAYEESDEEFEDGQEYAEADAAADAEAARLAADVAAGIEDRKALRLKLLTLIAECKDGDNLVTSIAARCETESRKGEHSILRADVAAALANRSKELGGRKLSKAELEVLFPKLGKTGVKHLTALPLTEFGVTERLRALHGHELLYTADSGNWYQYAAGHWQQEASPVRVVQMARTVIKGLRTTVEAMHDPEEMDDAMKQVEGCERTAFAAGVVNGLAGEKGIISSSLELDTYPDLLAAKNGLIDLRTGALLPADPTKKLTMVTACDYNPAAKCPVFEKTLSQALKGKTEVIEFLQRVMGYSITANPTERIMLVPLGKGKNGKSTIFNAIQACLGSHAATMNSNVIAAPYNQQPAANAGGPAEHLLRLRGKRAIFASEVKRASVFNDETVKTLAGGGDLVVARGLFSTVSVEFRPTGVVISPANVLAQVRDDDSAVWDRLLPIMFAVKFGDPGAPAVDLTLAGKLDAEKEGILAWLVRGALAYKEKGLAVPQCVHDLKQTQREGSSPIAIFLEEHCELSPEFADTTKNLYDAWRICAEDMGEKHLAQSEVAFGRTISQRPGLEPTRLKRGGKQHRGFRGLRLIGNKTEVEKDVDQEELDIAF